MSRIISRAESWEKSYEAFQNINFSSFDYEVVKDSLLNYLKTYHPENYNDYIESSEFIAQLELFAYLAEIMAYRVDMNSQENFLSTAQRKQSVLKLARLISYNPSRNIPARGLVKITSVSTSENVIDSDGVNLIYRNIIWNDPNNTKWKEQFFLVVDKILEQGFGTVSPNDRIQVDDVLFELYQLKQLQNGLANGVYSYNVTVSNTAVQMELVPSALDENGPYERRPDLNAPFTIVYSTDGLGDGSDATGFFFFTKQGSLAKFETIFDGITPNQTIDINRNNVNNIDVWINNVDPDTGVILDDGSVPNARSGDWQQVDIANAQNIIFNTNENRNKYEIETLENDNIRVIFGDGEFSNIPSGTFDIWTRASQNSNIVIPQNAINTSSTFSYYDINNNIQSFSFSFSLTSAIQNASISEDIEGIRRNAPSVYYSQDRMVNGRDYNTFMLQDPSILKLRAVNRTFAGDSKYIAWHDPKESYENVKLFGDDLVVYFTTKPITFTVNNTPIANVLDNDITNLLERMDVFLAISLLSQNNPTRRFSDDERTQILGVLNLMTVGDTAYLIHDPNISPGLWWTASSPGTTILPVVGLPTALIRIEQVNLGDWDISFLSSSMVAESNDTKFWNSNDGNTVVTYDTLLSTTDQIVLLKANENKNRDGLLSGNISFNVLGNVTIPSGLPDAGLPNINQLQIMPIDQNGDNVPDGVNLSTLINPQKTVTTTGVITLPISYINGNGDVSIVGNNATPVTWVESGSAGDVVNTVNITSLGTNTSAVITTNDYVYFYRPTVLDMFKPIETTNANIELYVADVNNTNYKRESGRFSFNFLWMHKTTSYHLVDPATSNIIDSFLITRGYYTNIKNWVEGLINDEPVAPTSQQLRSSYAKLLDNKMISDTVILHPGKFKILFGDYAPPELRATFKVIRSSSNRLTDNQIKSRIVTTIRNFFDISKWEFGEQFYFTELAAAIHDSLPGDIDSVVLVPTQSSNAFGDLFQVIPKEDEVLIANVGVNNIEIVSALNSAVIRQR